MVELRPGSCRAVRRVAVRRRERGREVVLDEALGEIGKGRGGGSGQESEWDAKEWAVGIWMSPCLEERTKVETGVRADAKKSLGHLERWKICWRRVCKVGSSKRS